MRVCACAAGRAGAWGAPGEPGEPVQRDGAGFAGDVPARPALARPAEAPPLHVPEIHLTTPTPSNTHTQPRAGISIGAVTARRRSQPRTSEPRRHVRRQ